MFHSVRLLATVVACLALVNASPVAEQKRQLEEPSTSTVFPTVTEPVSTVIVSSAGPISTVTIGTGSSSPTTVAFPSGGCDPFPTGTGSIPFPSGSNSEFPSAAPTTVTRGHHDGGGHGGHCPTGSVSSSIVFPTTVSPSQSTVSGGGQTVTVTVTETNCPISSGFPSVSSSFPSASSSFTFSFPSASPSASFTIPTTVSSAFPSASSSASFTFPTTVSSSFIFSGSASPSTVTSFPTGTTATVPVTTSIAF